MMKRKNLFLLLRITIAGLLIYWILSKIDITNLFKTLRGINIYFLILAFLLDLTRNIVGAFRVQILLKNKVSTKVLTLTRDYLVGIFFNNFLPTTIGGDIYRIQRLNKYGSPSKLSINIILIERFLGFFSLAILVLSTTSFFDFLWDLKVTKFAMLISSVILLLSLILIIKFFNNLIIRVLNWINLKFLSFIKEIVLFFSNYNTLVKVLILSLVYQLIGISTFYIIGISLGADISITYYLLFIPIVWIITMIPISINGIGVREKIFLTLFPLAGMSEEIAVAIPFLFLVQMLSQGIIGGIIWIQNQKTKKALA